MTNFKKIFFIFVFLLSGCSQIEFTYKDDINLSNPLFNKIKTIYKGEQIPVLHKYTSIYFGDSSDHTYDLEINITEKKNRRAVQANQAVSKLDYELIFEYKLFYIKEKCKTYNKSIKSRFSYVPKSSGYNFGSDKSLNKLYELAVRNNVQQFIGFVSQSDTTKCINES